MATSVPDTSVPDERRARHTCWTLNNWTEQDLESVRSYAKSQPRYMCWSQEIADSGTPHLQGYVAWNNPRSLEKFKAEVSKKLHYEPYTNGSAQQNRNYCLGMVEKKGFKQNPTFEEVGELPKQGERTDWRQAVEQINTGAHVHDVVQTQPQLLPAIRALERFKQLALKPKHRNVEVIYLTGAAGTGKSKWAWDNYPDLYSKPDGAWFDGYTGQTTLLLDDYYGDIPYPQFLKITDRYPLQVPVKGGFVHAQWERVIITSNHTIDKFYQVTDALKRRIKETHVFSITNNADGTQVQVKEGCWTPPTPRPSGEGLEGGTTQANYW